MNPVYALILLQIAGFWPVWRWYFARITDGSDEPFGIIAVLAALAIGFVRGQWSHPPVRSILFSILIAAVYTVSYPFLPFMGRGMLALLAVAFVVSPGFFRIPIQPGITGLLMLSLPLIASLQFYGGFPIRFLTATLSSQILGLMGYQVEAQGTILHWFGETIVVDAPCAGIKMLWSGLFFNFCLAAWFQLDLIETWVATSCTMFGVFVGNVIRASTLFFTESGIVDVPHWSHSAVGLTVFLVVSLFVFRVHYQIRRGAKQCAG